MNTAMGKALKFIGVMLAKMLGMSIIFYIYLTGFCYYCAHLVIGKDYPLPIKTAIGTGYVLILILGVCMITFFFMHINNVIIKMNKEA